MLQLAKGTFGPLREGLFLLTKILALRLRVVKAEAHHNLVWLCLGDMLTEDHRFSLRWSTRYAEIDQLNVPPRKLLSELCLSEIRVTLSWRQSCTPSERITQHHDATGVCRLGHHKVPFPE